MQPCSVSNAVTDCYRLQLRISSLIIIPVSVLLLLLLLLLLLIMTFIIVKHVKVYVSSIIFLYGTDTVSETLHKGRMTDA